MSNTIIITWVRNGMALGTKWYGTRAHRYEMTRNLVIHVSLQRVQPQSHKLNPHPKFSAPTLTSEVRELWVVIGFVASDCVGKVT